MSRMVAGLAVVLAGTILALPAANGADDKKNDETNRKLSPQEFVQQASASNLAEINLSHIAQTHAQSGDVKQFAQRMVDDHTKAGKELLEIADRKQIRPAQAMNPEHEEAARRLAQLQGEAFDHAYMKQMVEDHKKAVDLFSAEAKDGQDKDLQGFAEKTLPTIKDHLKMARDMSKHSENGSSKEATSSKENSSSKKKSSDSKKDSSDKK